MLTRDFKHTHLDFSIVEEEGEKKVKLDCHFGKRKALAVMRTVTSHITNLFVGVTKARPPSAASRVLSVGRAPLSAVPAVGASPHPPRSIERAAGVPVHAESLWPAVLLNGTQAGPHRHS